MDAASRCVMACALVSWVVGASHAHAEVSFEEKRILTVPAPPKGWLQEDWVPMISRDGRRGAALVPLWRDSKPRAFGQFGRPGTKRCYLLVVDDGVVDPCSWADVQPTFSPDGRHVVYVRADHGGAGIYVDGKEVVRPSDRPIGAGMLADGTLTYVLQTSAPGAASKQRLVVGGHEDPLFDDLADITLSPDGSALAYVGRGPGSTVMVRGRKLAEFESVHGIAWTPDGREVVALGRPKVCEQRSCWCVSRGQKCVHEDGLTPGPWALSPDGLSIAIARSRAVRDESYEPGRDDRYWVTYGAMRGPEVLAMRSGPVLDARGSHVAYAAVTTGGGVRVFRDTEPVGDLLQEAGAIAFSSDGTHLAWVGRAGGHFRVFVDGVPGPEHDWAQALSFDPAGKQIAYAARDQPNGPWHVVAGKVSGPATDWVGPLRWSFDGNRVAYAARIGREVWWKVLLVP
jgi:hypothetical protein